MLSKWQEWTNWFINLDEQDCIGFYLVHTSQTVDIKDPIQAFKQWGKQSAAMVFREGWKNLFGKKKKVFEHHCNSSCICYGWNAWYNWRSSLLLKRHARFNSSKIGKALLCDSVANLTGKIRGVENCQNLCRILCWYKWMCNNWFRCINNCNLFLRWNLIVSTCSNYFFHL